MSEPRQTSSSAFCYRRLQADTCPNAIAAMLVFAAFWISGAPLQAQAVTTAESLWERSPYKIALMVTTDRSPAWGSGFVERLRGQLAQSVETRIGAAWQMQLDARVIPETSSSSPSATALSPPAAAANPGELFAAWNRWGSRGLSRLSAEDLANQKIPFDKVLFVHARAPSPSIWSDATAASRGYRIEARDYDVRTATLGTLVTEDCAQRPLLAEIAFEALVAAFSPLAEVETAVGQEATVRIKAGALPPRDSRLQFVKPGDLLQPLIRYNYRDGSLRRLQPLDWTFLQVMAIEPDLVKCQVYTGLRSPLSSRRRGLIEQLAVVVRPPSGNSRLKLTSNAAENEPLPGYAVFAQRPGEVATERVGESDLQGELEIPASDTPLRILLVKNGDEILARLPLVPGLHARVVARVPDDRLRLYAESIITGLQEQVIDVLSRRTVLLAQAQAQLEQGNMERARRLLQELQLLKTADAFQAELNQFERRIFTNDPRMKLRIEKLFTDTRQVVSLHLDPKPIQDLAGQINAAP